MKLSDAGYCESIVRDGFAVVDSVLPVARVERLIAALDTQPSPHSSRRRGRGEAYAMRNLLSLVRAVDGLPEFPELISLVRPILGDKARAVRGILFDKTPQANWRVGWHQDCAIAVARRIDLPGFGPWSVKAGIPHVQPPVDVLRNMLTLRLHLDNCPLENGPLDVVPGSHRLGILEADQIRPACSAGPIQSLPLSAGGVVVMRPLLLHSSRPSTVAAHRRVIHIEYAGIDLPGGLSWVENDG